MKSLALFAFGCACLSGSIVTTYSGSCSTDGQVTTSDTSFVSCRAPGGNTAGASVFFTLNGLNTTTVTGSADGFPTLFLFTQDTSKVAASISGTLTATLITDGPIRPGVLTVNGSVDSDGSGLFSGVASFSVDSVGGPGCGGAGCFRGINQSVPIMLGTAFTLQMQVSASASNSRNPIGEAGAGGLNFTLQVFDSTNFGEPVQILNAPEPSSIAMLGLGVCGLIALRREA